MNSNIAWAYLVNFLYGNYRMPSEASTLAARIAHTVGNVSDSKQKQKI